MKILNCEQYSEEWWAARRGLPTSSAFGKLITPGGQPSTQAKQYMYQLIAECITTEEQDSFEPTEWMIRGTLLEEEARDWFAMQRGKEVQQVGFILNDDETAGCSPDGLLDDNVGLEIKCPKASTHVGYLLNGKLPPAYAPQVHGSLLITGFPKWVFCSYHPDFKPFVIEVQPDGYTKKLSNALNKFILDLGEAKRRIVV